MARLTKDARRQILACAILASLILTLSPSLKAAAIAPVQLSNWPAWNGYMSHTPAPGVGCFKVTFPNTAWQPSQCVSAPLLPLLPSTVGDGNDYVAQSPSTLIGSSFGSFQSISGLTSETDSKFGADYYTLQDNSNFFTTSSPSTGGKSTTGWEQFVYVNTGFIFIQYWLIGYQTAYGSCPSTGPPGGSSWMLYLGNCYANSPASIAPSETVTNLGNLILNGYANFAGSNDEVAFCISGGSCYTVVITDQVVNLYLHWQDAEFNVFGYSDGSEANFNSGTSITVVNSLNDQSGSLIVPSCLATGYTGETNNLNLGSCSLNGSGQIVFTESNVGTTYSATFTESGIPSGTTWGVTVGGTHQTSSSIKGITVSGLTGTVSYSYDSPVWGSGGSYSCASSCSGSVSGVGTVTATYTSAFDFRLSNSGSTSNLGGISVVQGSSGSITIAVSLVSGLTQTVSLSCSGAAGALPTGVSCSFNPASGSPSFTSTLTVFTTLSTPTGYYTIKVTGTAGTLSRSTLFVLNVT